jgi:hypothetical protein
MDVTVLAVPDCPNAALLEERLASVLASYSQVTVSRYQVTSAEQAACWGMCGSPTILVNGTDPFAEPGQLASVSCRLYRDSSGQVTGAPSGAQLRQAIEQAAGALPSRLVCQASLAHQAHAARTAAAQAQRPRVRALCAAVPSRSPLLPARTCSRRAVSVFPPYPPSPQRRCPPHR